MSEPQRYQLEYSTVLPGRTVSQVWQRVGSWEGVNHELGPLFRMTFPRAFSQISDIPADGNSHFVSTILLFGFIPFDRHRFSLIEIDVPNYFSERSSNFTMSLWSHRRTLIETEDGVTVNDVCHFVPRVSLMGRVLRAVYAAVFRRRHKRLARYFGEGSVKPDAGNSKGASR